MPATPQACRRYREKLRERAFALVGYRCVFCGANESIQLAHVGTTSLRGPGRGLSRRYSDVVKNPSKYRPMCVGCHRTFDALVNAAVMDKIRLQKEEAPF